MPRRIMIATPAANGLICTETHGAICMSIEEGTKQGWEVRSLASRSGADIAYARNLILGIFLATDADDILMVDADITWHPLNFTQIMSHPVDFVAGLYRQRVEDRVHYPVRWPEKKSMTTFPETGLPLIEADGVPGGFVRVTRSCVEAMRKHKECVEVSDEHAEKLGVTIPWLFEWTWQGPKRHSEDYTFCNRWRDMGGTVWVDPSLRIDHIGHKVFSGDLLSYLAQESGFGAQVGTPNSP